MDIVETWREDLRQVLADEPVTVSDLRIGVFYTAAQLSSGHVGVAFTPRNMEETVCCPRTLAAAPAAGQLVGQDAWSLAQDGSSRFALQRAVGIAVLNALSALAMTRHPLPGARILPDMDALGTVEIQPADTVVMVGGFIPFIKKLKDEVAALWIVDKHPDALKPGERKFWRPPEQAEEVLAQANVVIVTGSALVEGDLDPLLSAASGARRLVLAGPTASPWPPTFFARGIHVLGGIRVLDGAKMLQLVSEGGSGYFFYEGIAEKICVVREPQPSAAAL